MMSADSHADPHASGLAVLAEASWPPSGQPDARLAPVGRFVESSFPLLVVALAERCLRQRYGDPSGAERDGPGTGLVLLTERADAAATAAVERAVATDTPVNKPLLFQTVPTAALGHVAAQWGLAGPMVSLTPVTDSLGEGFEVASLLLRDGPIHQVLLITADQASDARPDTGQALLLAASPEHESHAARHRSRHTTQETEMTLRTPIVTDPLDSAATPSLARMYDWMLGGSANHECDRQAIAALEAARPGARISAHANRAFLQATVRFCLDAGITQFLELGSGLPTMGHVHEIAPGARVVYVDIEPAALAVGLPLLAGNPSVAMIEADLRDPDAVLSDPAVTRVLTLSQPIALLLVSVLHWIGDDEDPVGIVAAYRDRLAPGSLIAISHLTTPAPVAGTSTNHATDRTTRHVPDSDIAAHAQHLHARSPAEVETLFSGLEIVRPGLVDLLRPPLPDAGAPLPDASPPLPRQPRVAVTAGLGYLPPIPPHTAREWDPDSLTKDGQAHAPHAATAPDTRPKGSKSAP